MAALEPTLHGPDHTGHGHGGRAERVTDPVCGMSVDPATARHRVEHAGREYFFCGPRCRERFLAEPERFLGGKAAAPPKAAADAKWTCPMHPEIVRDGPGSCPICGMALEPMTPTADEAENPELADMSRRFWVSALLSAPLLAMAMAEHIGPHWMHAAFGSRLAVWVQLILASPVVLWGGAPFFRRGWESLRNRSLNMFTLIALGTGVAYLYSLVAALAPDIFPASFRTPEGNVPVYF